jgi:hypothetical protein
MVQIAAIKDKLIRVGNKIGLHPSCCCDKCCAIGDGKGGFFLAGTGGDTCWDVSGNAHIFFSKCTTSSITIQGLGIIGNIAQQDIEDNVKYNNKLISFSLNPENCPINEAIISTSKANCISITANGSRNTGNAQNWEHSPGIGDPFPGCGMKRPGLVGGQGAYTINISDIDKDGDFLVYLKLGCGVGVGGAAPLFPNSPEGKNGTYFYVAGDNQNIDSTLNGNPALTCGDGPMIEAKVLPNFGNVANWGINGDCIVWLVEGWVVPK